MFRFHMEGRGELFSGQKIGTGYFRDCYSIENHEDICIKVVKTRLSFFRKLQVSFFRINLNREEFETWQRLPQEIKNYFNPVLEANKNFAVTYIPLNYDGTYAQSLRNHKGVENENFWKEVGFIFHYMAHNKIWFLDVFNGNNMFVVKKAKRPGRLFSSIINESGGGLIRSKLIWCSLSGKSKSLKGNMTD